MPLRIFTLITFLTLVSGRLAAQEIKLKKGQKFVFETEQTVRLSAGSTFLYHVYEFRVKGKDPSGNYLLEMEMLAVRQKSENGGRTFVFNSDSIRNASFNTTASLDQLAILRRPFMVTLSPKGEVVEAEAATELAKEAAKRWELTPDIADQLIQNAAMTKHYVQEIFLRLPGDGKLKEGTAWIIPGDTTRYRVADASDGYTILSSNGGRYQLERKSLLLRNHTRTFETSDNAGRQAARGRTEVNRLTTYTIRSAIDTTWVNMVVSSSFWSNKLRRKSDREYDSLKVARFMEKYGKLYGDDPVYVDNALNALQQADNYEKYDQWIKSIPNSLLINSSSHLHNKLQQVHESAPEESLEIVKILNERYPESLYGWVQHSFSQAFLNMQANNDRQKTANKLLAMCVNDPDESVQRQFAPLAAWVRAKAAIDTEPGREQAVLSIRQMDKRSWKESNLGRYSLLITQLLDDAGDLARADELLDYSLDQLQKTVDDSLNKYQISHRNMLAHAYFMKYRRTLPADSVAAFGYLKKAADHSPKSSAEKSHDSFYDRVFLHSKESYRSDYMAALSRLGRMEDALNAVVAEFNADPLKLPELRDYYKRAFPERDFAAFFANDVVGNWNEAPAFSLSNLADQPVSLESYAGKWLVVDFWGTWCGPCKEEMPQINTFYQKINKGTLPGVDFLSIACYDTKEKVADYLSGNNFKLPAVLSDGEVQKNYKIKGYPTKVLISPNGKMKMLRFGAKWEVIIEQISEAYPGTEKEI